MSSSRPSRRTGQNDSKQVARVSHRAAVSNGQRSKKRCFPQQCDDFAEGRLICGQFQQAAPQAKQGWTGSALRCLQTSTARPGATVFVYWTVSCIAFLAMTANH